MRYAPMSAAAREPALTMEVREGGVAVVKFDVPGEKVNTLCTALTDDFRECLDKIDADESIKSVVLMSGKDSCFIAGADIAQLDGCSTSQELQELSQMGQQMMDRVENNKRPFVAAIHGPALGGGLEVALACDYRICTEHKSTNMALPEVQLGLLPGAGGTQRLPRLIGLEKAMPLMLQGKNVKPKQAKRMGLVDGLADPNALEHAAVFAARGLADGSIKMPAKRRKKKDVRAKFLEDTPVGRKIFFDMAKKMVDKQTGGKYPAPYKIMDAAQSGVADGPAKGYATEAAGFGELGMTPEAKSLISVFFGMTEKKKGRFGAPEKKAETVAVIGAGLMGAGIAQVSASQAKCRVLLKDRDAEAASRGEGYVRANLDKRVKRRAMSGFDRDRVMSAIVPLTDAHSSWPRHASHADLVIEAVFEDLALKHKIIGDLEEIVSDDCVIATNTSAIPIADIAAVAKHPERVLGMHYFSPVEKMPLLEIIMHDKTSEEAARVANDVGIRQGKTCIVVKDVPGFYVNRCLGPYLAESMALVTGGVGLLELDAAMKSFGMPVGPITLADEVGVDVASHVGVFLSENLGPRMADAVATQPVMETMVAQGLLGKKTGKGFFVHGTGKKAKKTLNPEAEAIIKQHVKSTGEKLPVDLIQDRMMARFINEAIMCLQDDIVFSPTDGDVGAVFGIGFPPFHGGPFRYVDAIGSRKYCDMMSGFADKYGEQFAPCDMLKDYAKENKKFHSS